MTYEVKMGVPIPKPKTPRKVKSKLRVSLEEMPVGGMIEEAGDKRHFRSVVVMLAKVEKINGGKFTTRTIADGVLGIWRLA